MNKSLQVLLGMGIHPNNIMLTGSVALEIHGILPKGRHPHDADFIVRNLTEEQRSVLKLLDRMYGGNHEAYSRGNRNFYTFTINGITTNIWEEETFPTVLVWADHENVGKCWVSPVRDILDAKKRYSRKKDLEDIRDISLEILG